MGWDLEGRKCRTLPFSGYCDRTELPENVEDVVPSGTGSIPHQEGSLLVYARRSTCPFLQRGQGMPKWHLS